MRGVPAIPCAYPTRCVGCFNIHPGKRGKKRKSTQLPVEGPSAAARRAQADSVTLRWTLSWWRFRSVGEKKPEKIHSKGPGLTQQVNFPTVIKIHNLKTEHAHFRQRLDKQQCVCVRFPALGCASVEGQQSMKMFALIKRQFCDGLHTSVHTLWCFNKTYFRNDALCA